MHRFKSLITNQNITLCLLLKFAYQSLIPPNLLKSRAGYFIPLSLWSEQDNFYFWSLGTFIFINSYGSEVRKQFFKKSPLNVWPPKSTKFSNSMVINLTTFLCWPSTYNTTDGEHSLLRAVQFAGTLATDLSSSSFPQKNTSVGTSSSEYGLIGTIISGAPAYPTSGNNWIVHKSQPQPKQVLVWMQVLQQKLKT